ncbi:flagellin [Burkholderiaceae bacterium 16]|nr:flagellin [Burkholderiaceae bacterium 16]
MASIINTNSLSLMTQNNLNASQSQLNTAIQRLSSGLRINSAKDDAAGLAIANRFTANINGLTQAKQNANDGISLAQTTEGALTEVTNNLQRIRTLSVQAANGSNSASDLQSIQDEIGQRMDEINRISAQTDFNGVKVLSTSAKPLNIQVGASDSQTISVNLQEISTKTLGMTSFNVNQTGTVNSASGAQDLAAAKYTAGAVVNGTTTYTLANAGNATASSLSDVLSKVKAGGTVKDAGNANATYTSNGTDYTFTDTTRTAANVKSDLIPAAGGVTTATVKIGNNQAVDIKIDSNGNVSATNGQTLYLDTTGNLTTNNASGLLNQATIGGATGDLLASMGSAAPTGGGTITTSAGAIYTYTAGTATADAKNIHISSAALTSQLQASNAANAVTIKLDGTAATQYNVAIGGAVTDPNNLNNAVFNDMVDGGLTSQANSTLFLHSNGTVTDASANTVYNDSANPGKFSLKATSGNTSTTNPLDVLDKALSMVDKLRSSLGAIQNRLDSTIANLGTTITNLSSSRSRIQDADYATEVSNMTRGNILQQAGTSVLAQANQTTQGVLSLLR